MIDQNVGNLKMRNHANNIIFAMTSGTARFASRLFFACTYIYNNIPVPNQTRQIPVYCAARINHAYKSYTNQLSHVKHR